MRQGGLYEVEKGKKKPKRIEGTAEHKEGNRPRDSKGAPIAPMRRAMEAPKPAVPAVKPDTTKEK